MAFSTQNSARRIVVDAPKWKSRPLDLGNRHRTTLNFGDLVPAFWQHVQPGDKLKIDASVLVKFLPLLAPAFSRMKVRSEWFYVPLKQISPVALRALQDFTPSDASTAFSELLQTGKFGFTPRVSDDQQRYIMEGFPSLPAYSISRWFATNTATVWQFSGSWSASTDYAYRGSDISGVSQWRTSGSVSLGLDGTPVNLGLEDFVCYASMRRQSKLCSYMGLPKRLTTMRYTDDVISVMDSNVASSFSGATWLDGSLCNVDYFANSDSAWDGNSFFNHEYWLQNFGMVDFLVPSGGVIPNTPLPYSVFSTYGSAWLTSITSSSVTVSGVSGYNFPACCTFSPALISLLPFMAYQKIFNDFYRDEKLQTDEIRLYSDAVYDSVQKRLVSGFSRSLTVYCNVDNTSSNHNIRNTSDSSDSFRRVANNLLMLRRRNRAKDVLSSCVTDKVLVNRLAGASTAPNVFQSNLFSKVEKYLMKKEFTGSTWAEWLGAFFGENSNDYLNNNVIFLGQKESIVSISENIQTSETTQDSAQGNRGGLAADFHAGNEIYFRVPDFGILMCIVSVIPDDLDNFNGLQERFERYSPYQFNLPDLQNLGFAPVFNRRANISWFDSYTNVSQMSTNDRITLYDGSAVFGYQPFGYEHTYTPDVISGDFQTSLRYWHQSPDLDLDFTNVGLLANPSLRIACANTWRNGQLQLNPNLPAIGLRQQPLGASLSSQYYNNVFAVTNDESGDHIVADMRFFVTCHRNTAFFTDAIEDEK